MRRRPPSYLCRAALCLTACLAAICLAAQRAGAQEAADQPSPNQAPADQPSSSQRSSSERSTAPPQFAPGVLTTIPPELDSRDALSIHDLPAIRAQKQLQWQPASTAVTRTLYEMAKDAAFIEDLWCLELTIKPLRMIEVDVPQTDGRLARKLVWYMVYRVRNVGAGLDAKIDENGKFVTESAETDEIRFIPQFVLSVHDRSSGNGDEGFRKAYLDRLVPAAMGAIERREFSGRELLNSVQVAQGKVRSEADGRSVWGVAMWEDVDPTTDFFSVYIAGLTNAYRWEDAPGEFQVGDAPGKGRTFTRKTLQLNFWRPGDEYRENEREIRFGVPPGESERYGAGEGVAYRWVFR